MIVWPVDVIAQYNQDYEVDNYNPGLVYFGSDGSGMAFAFDKRTEEMPIVMLPFISIDLEEVEKVSDTFYGFLEYLYHA